MRVQTSSQGWRSCGCKLHRQDFAAGERYPRQPRQGPESRMLEGHMDEDHAQVCVGPGQVRPDRSKTPPGHARPRRAGGYLSPVTRYLSSPQDTYPPLSGGIRGMGQAPCTWRSAPGPLAVRCQRHSDNHTPNHTGRVILCLQRQAASMSEHPLLSLLGMGLVDTDPHSSPSLLNCAWDVNVCHRRSPPKWGWR